MHKLLLLVFLLPFISATPLEKPKLACYRRDCSELWFQTYNLTHLLHSHFSAQNTTNLTNFILEELNFTRNSVVDLRINQNIYYDRISTDMSKHYQTNTVQLEDINKNIKAINNLLGTLVFSPTYLARPIFSNDYEIVKVHIGESLNILCRAQGENIQYELLNDNVPFDLNNSRFTLVYTKFFVSFQIYPFEETDVNTFVLCTAKNEHGLASKIYEIKVLPSIYTADDGSTTTKAPAVKDVNENWDKYLLAILILVSINTVITFGPILLSFIRGRNGF